MGHIELLRQKLCRVGWIPSDTQPDDFANLFTGKANLTKIVWKEEVGKGMLAFLFAMMKQQNHIAVPKNHSLNTILEHHFVDTDGQPLTGLHSSKPTDKFMPIVKECLDLLQIEVAAD